MSDPVPFVQQTLKVSKKWEKKALLEMINALEFITPGTVPRPDPTKGYHPLRGPLNREHAGGHGWEIDVIFKDSETAARFAALLASKEIGL